MRVRFVDHSGGRYKILSDDRGKFVSAHLFDFVLSSWNRLSDEEAQAIVAPNFKEPPAEEEKEETV